MNLLAPLYLLGALAVAAPIVFHLIRRSPRGEVSFSSLMFLSPTPPKLTRRSRLDDWLLLLLRAAAILLLAFAFARPFLREAIALDSGDDEQRRIAVLVDTSASMRRADLWDEAVELAEEAIAESRPGDEIALFAFDDRVRPVFTFSESKTLDAERRQAVAMTRLKELVPTWGATDLGLTLVEAAGAISDVSDVSERAGRVPKRIVLVTDLQQGSRLEALGAFEWPAEVMLDLRTVGAGGTNASLQRLGDAVDDGAANDETLRIRVSNGAESRQEKFRLAWVDNDGAARGDQIDAYVPPGMSRVVRVPPAPSGVTTLRLEGDDHGFDDLLFVAERPKEEVEVAYVGEEAASDPAGLLYFLERVFQETPRRSIGIRRSEPAQELDLGEEASLAVLAAPTSRKNLESLKQFMASGGTTLCVLRSLEQSATLADLLGVEDVPVEEAAVDGDVMLGEIAFHHPLFSPFAGAQFNDFTKIRFWKYRRLDARTLGDVQVVARFESGDPAVVEKAFGKGRLIVLTSGWNPADSQLARSSKFVPLMAKMLDRQGTPSLEGYAVSVNDPVPLPTPENGHAAFVRKPDGSAVQMKEGGDTTFQGTDQPGIYTVEVGNGRSSFAVNLDPAESKTTPLAVETLEQLGLRLSDTVDPVESPDQKRQMLNAELEGRQKLWRWLVLAAAGVLIVETWLAGRLGRSRGAGDGEVATV